MSTHYSTPKVIDENCYALNILSDAEIYVLYDDKYSDLKKVTTLPNNVNLDSFVLFNIQNDKDPVNNHKYTQKQLWAFTQILIKQREKGPNGKQLEDIRAMKTNIRLVYNILQHIYTTLEYFGYKVKTADVERISVEVVWDTQTVNKVTSCSHAVVDYYHIAGVGYFYPIDSLIDYGDEGYTTEDIAYYFYKEDLFELNKDKFDKIEFTKY